MKKIIIIFLLLPVIAHSQWMGQSLPGPTNMILSIDFSGQNIGAAGGWRWTFTFDIVGNMNYTTNSGTNWLSAQIPDSSRAIVKVQMINSATGYISGAYNTSAAPDDNIKMRGKEFLSSLPPNIQDHFYRIGISSEAGTGYKGMFLRTTSGGQSWQAVNTLPSNVYYLTGMKFININTGYVTASLEYFMQLKAGILKTTNGGLNWSNLITIDSVDLSNIYTSDGINILSGGWGRNGTIFNGFILRSTNSGLSWTRQNFVNTAAGCNDINFINTSTGYTVSVDGASKAMIFKSTNAGLNWTRLGYQPDGYIYNGIEFVSGTGKGIAVGSAGLYAGVISRTTDYGENWMSMIILDSLSMISSKLIDQNIWFACGGGTEGIILKSTNGGAIGITPVSNKVPEKYSLYQNYPNPFNPVTNIIFELPEQTGVKLIISDISGREVARLVNEKLPPGTYKVDWNASGYASGIYLYTISAGKYFESRKMVLIK